MIIKKHLKTILFGIIRMEIHKIIQDNGYIEIDEYYDVNDDELIELVQTYPNLLDDNNNVCTRYHQLFQLDGLVLDNNTTDEIAMC